MDDTSDVVTVDRYGRANPGVFGGVWFDRDRLQVGITAELELHEARLRPLLTLPDRVDVVPARRTVEHLGGVRVEAERIVGAHPDLLARPGWAFSGSASTYRPTVRRWPRTCTRGSAAPWH